MYQFIKQETKEGVAIISLNRVEVFNSFTIPMALELQKALDEAEKDPQVRSIILTGEGKGFCAGQDLKEAITFGSERIEEIVATTYNPIVTRLRNIEKPIIGAVNGIAAGAGANVALACDIVIAAQSATFIQAFSSIGLIPDSGGTFMLPRLIGMQRAAAQMFLADKITAKQAKEIGMIYEVVADDQFQNFVWETAKKLAQRPTKAIGLTKRLLNMSLTNTLEQQLEAEKEVQAIAGKTFDNKEGITAFLEKRKPIFKGE